MKDNSGIYAILNLVNGKYYIGSAVNLSYRWRLHKGRLKNKDHHNLHLQNAVNKYGIENFLFVVLEYTENENDLLNKENFWINETNCIDKEVGYNKRLVAQSNFGLKRSEASKLKSSLAQKGRIFTESHKAAMRGIKRSLESRKRMSLSKTG